MKYERAWSNNRNAAGFAAACARLALRFYVGGHRSNVIAAIEIAEHYANGEQTDPASATRAAEAAYRGADGTDAVHATPYDIAYAAAYAAAYTAEAADSAAHRIYTNYVAYAAARAASAGVDDSEIQIAYARWVTRDLSQGRELPDELRQAAGAAIVADDEELARELL